MTAHLAKACADAAAAAAQIHVDDSCRSNKHVEESQADAEDAADSSDCSGGGQGDSGGGDQGCSSLAGTWSEVLQQKILSGPPPWDCGVLGVRVTLEEVAAGGAVRQGEEKKVLCVEFAAVHSSRSFGVGFYGPGLGLQVQVMRQRQQGWQAGGEVGQQQGAGSQGCVQVLESCCKWPFTDV